MEKKAVCLELELVTTEKTDNGACGPETCKWVGCDVPST